MSYYGLSIENIHGLLIARFVEKGIDPSAPDRRLRLGKREAVARRLKYQIDYVIDEVFERLHEQSASLLDADKIRAFQTALENDLDKSPPSSTSKQVFRPMWPMTLAQLRQQVQEQVETHKNPAPFWKRPPDQKKGDWDYWQRYSMRNMENKIGLDGVGTKDYSALLGMAWQASAPEGFPPIPRRAGVYSVEEAVEINHWLMDLWPVRKEVLAICRRLDQRIRKGRYSYSLLEGYSSGTNPPSIEVVTGNRLFRELPSAKELSPKSFWMEILTWAKYRLFPLLDALNAFPVEVLKPVWDDPDAHIAAMKGNIITQDPVVIKEVIQHYPVDYFNSYQWLEDLLPKQQFRSLEHYVGEVDDPARQRFKLSTLIKTQQQWKLRKEEEWRKAELARQTQARPVKDALRALLQSGAPFTDARVERALPRGFALKSEAFGAGSSLSWKKYTLEHLPTRTVVYQSRHGVKPPQAMKELSEWVQEP